ncbi:methyltransferase domain-containing protein [candidate division WWE3 bacterium]|nr:methyltransferase domain-containing protein [candidate division WWE3 bacterium]
MYNRTMFNLPKRKDKTKSTPQNSNSDKTTNWDRVADDYNNLIGETGDFNHKTYINPVILEILGNLQNKNIMDLACGQGYFSKILADKGAHVLGVDISEKLIEMAKENFAEKVEQNKIKFIARNAADLTNVKSNQFDAVVVNMAFHDIKELSEVMAEIARVIQIGGKLVFSIPHPWTHMAKTVKEKDNYYLRLENYRKVMEIPNKLYGEEGIMSYHRPLQFYVERLTEHKFEITDFREISREHVRADELDDKEYLEFKKEFPSFLVVGAVKRLEGE